MGQSLTLLAVMQMPLLLAAISNVVLSVDVAHQGTPWLACVTHLSYILPLYLIKRQKQFYKKTDAILFGLMNFYLLLKS